MIKVTLLITALLSTHGFKEEEYLSAKNITVATPAPPPATNDEPHTEGQKIVKNLKGAQDTLIKRKSDISHLKQRVNTLIQKEKNTQQHNDTSSFAVPAATAKEKKDNTESPNQDRRWIRWSETSQFSNEKNEEEIQSSRSNSEDEHVGSNKNKNNDNSNPDTTTNKDDNSPKEANKNQNTTSTTPDTHSIDEWENSALAKLDKYSHEKNNHSSSIKTTTEGGGSSLLSKLGNWLSGDLKEAKEPKATTATENVAKGKEDQALEELKESIRHQAEEQRKDRAKDRERMDALEDVVQELTGRNIGSMFLYFFGTVSFNSCCFSFPR